MARRTVRDLKTQYQLEFFGGLWPSWSDLPEEHREFWDKLNRLGFAKATKSALECDDIDATAFISEELYEKLLAEARRLPPVPASKIRGLLPREKIPPEKMPPEES